MEKITNKIQTLGKEAYALQSKMEALEEISWEKIETEEYKELEGKFEAVANEMTDLSISLLGEKAEGLNRNGLRARILDTFMKA